MLELNLIKIGITILILLYVNILDWKYREIDDKSWISLLAVGIIFFLIDFYSSRDIGIAVLFIWIFGITVIMGYIFYYLGLWGGGDAKIIWGLGAVTYNIQSPESIYPFFILAIFINSVLFSVLLPLRFIIINLAYLPKVRSPKELLACFIGYRKQVSKINEFEAVFGVDGKFNLLMNANTMEMGAGSLPKDKIVWVTPGIPFLIPISLGFVFALFVGDITSILFFRGLI